MKGLEKLTSVRLAEVLTQKNAVAAEVITDALYSQDKHGDPFPQVLVSGGHITEWDLAKLVTENFQLPFLMAGNYQIAEDAKLRLPKELLFRNLIVPIDAFDDVVCIAMPVLTSFEVLMKIQKEHDCDLFPYVGLISENRKVLGDLFKEFPQWATEDQKRREIEATKRAQQAARGEKSGKGGGWMSIFDAGDMAIQETLGSGGGGAGKKEKADIFGGVLGNSPIAPPKKEFGMGNPAAALPPVKKPGSSQPPPDTLGGLGKKVTPKK